MRLFAALLMIELPLLVTVGRGALELVMPKSTAFIVQGAVLSCSLSILWLLRINRTIWVRNGSRSVLILASLFLFIALISVQVTIDVHPEALPWPYLGVALFTIFMWTTTCVLEIRGAAVSYFGVATATTVLLLVGIAMLEQGGAITMPGAANIYGIVRPASITGSKQHYAIAIALLAFVCMEWYWQTGQRRYLLSAAIGAVGSGLSLTRSGPMIVGIGIVYVMWRTLSFRLRGILVRRNGRGQLQHAGSALPTIGMLALRSQRRRRRVIWMFSVVMLVSGITIMGENIQAAPYIERILSSVDLEAAGNTGRVKAWLFGYRLWRETSLVVGQYTGIVTNATNRLTAVDSYIVESSVVQQLLNFGMVGVVLYYAMWFRLLKTVQSSHLWLRAAGVGGLVQSFVYQSIETVPFIVIIGLLPWFSDTLSRVTASAPIVCREANRARCRLNETLSST